MEPILATAKIFVDLIDTLSGGLITISKVKVTELAAIEADKNRSSSEGVRR